MQDIVIVCNDLFGIEVYSLIDEINRRAEKANKGAVYHIKGFLYIQERPFNESISPVKLLGDLDNWTPDENEKVVLGIADPEIKGEAVSILREKGAKFQTIITPWMLVLPDQLQIGEGSILSAYSAKDGLIIGDFVTVIASMISGHIIGDYSTVMRFANIAGDSIGRYSYVGNHVFLAVGKSIGDNCRVADGSIVVKNVKSGVYVSGVPAKKVK